MSSNSNLSQNSVLELKKKPRQERRGGDSIKI